MLIQSAIISKGSGSIGGTTASRNRFGMYFRSRSNPVNPNTDLQSAVRSRLAQLTEAWGNLTEVQRQGWNDYAAQVPRLNKLGESIFVTGFNMFIRTNTVNLQCGGSQIDDAPTELLLPGADSTFTVTASEATQQLSVAFDTGLDWVSEDGAFLAVFMGLPRNTQVNFFGGPWRFADSIDGDSGTPPTSPQTLAVPFAVTEGQKVWARARIIRADGRVSDPFRDSTAVSA
jgi:hypothetical protein